MNTTPDLLPPDAGAALSPKLAWLALHGLCTWHTPGLEGDEESPETGEPIKAWTCAKLDAPEQVIFGKDGTGDTEQEACAAYAIKHGLRLWNEQEAAP